MICSGKYVPLIASFHNSMCLAKTYAVHSQMWESFRQREQYNIWNLFPATQAPDYICELSVQPQALGTVKTHQLPPFLSQVIFETDWDGLLCSPQKESFHTLLVCVCVVSSSQCLRHFVWRSTRIYKGATKNLSSKQSQMFREYMVWYLWIMVKILEFFLYGRILNYLLWLL